MRRKSLLSIFIGLMAMLPALSSFASNQFNDEQKQEIQQIVHDYLLEHPEILLQVNQALQAKQDQQFQQMEQQAQNVIPKIASTLFQATSSPVSGNATGKISLVEFFDYQCPHCKEMIKIIENLQASNPDLKIVYKELPIMGKNSVFAAKAALAANQQGKYLSFHNALLAANDPVTEDKILAIATSLGIDIAKMKKDMDDKAVNAELKQNLKLAQELKLIGTPAFIIGQSQANYNKAILIPGNAPQDALQAVINQVGK